LGGLGGLVGLVVGLVGLLGLEGLVSSVVMTEITGETCVRNSSITWMLPTVRADARTLCIIATPQAVAV
jgi:hypothetical protein